MHYFKWKNNNAQTKCAADQMHSLRSKRTKHCKESTLATTIADKPNKVQVFSISPANGTHNLGFDKSMTYTDRRNAQLDADFE